MERTRPEASRIVPRSIPEGLAREHVLRALADLDAGVAHRFGAPTGYELVHGGRRYPPKAAVGLALAHLRGGTPGPDEFSGGEGPGQANRVRRLSSGTAPPTPSSRPRGPGGPTAS